jgi:hypothetical protein
MKISFVIFLVVFTSCSSSINENKNEIENVVIGKEIKNTQPAGAKEPLVQDTLREKGKVYGITRVNDSIFYYRVFYSKNNETDRGRTLLKVCNKSDLLWLSELNDELVFNNDNTLIKVDLNSNCIYYFSIFNGDNLHQICLPDQYLLTDANEFVATTKGLYIKLVNEDDYGFKDVLFINSERGYLKELNLNYKGYFELKESSKGVVLVDQDKILEIIEAY